MRGIFLGGALLAASAVALAGALRAGSHGPAASHPSPRTAPPATPGFYSPPDELLTQVRECSGNSPDRYYEFYFTRAIYSESAYGGGGGGRRSFRSGGDWAMDYPKADCQFITVVKRLAGLDMFDDSNAIRLDNPEIRNFPFLYALEVGRNGGMNLE